MLHLSDAVVETSPGFEAPRGRKIVLVSWSSKKILVLMFRLETKVFVSHVRHVAFSVLNFLLLDFSDVVFETTVLVSTSRQLEDRRVDLVLSWS